MIKMRWKLSDSKVVSKNGSYDHLYIFNVSNEEAINIPNTINLSYQRAILSDVTSNTAKIAIGDLKKGQSGIVVHNTMDNKSIIVSLGEVVSSSTNSSILKLTKKDMISQNAIPTTKLKPQNGDLFVLNHLYGTSLLIAPNMKAKKIVKKSFFKQNFLSEDFFASYLKLHETPSPSKEIIQGFCNSQQIGTVFIVIKDTLYIVDANSFKVIDSQELTIDDSTTKLPFYTRIENIKGSFFDFDLEIDLFGFNNKKKLTNYNKYYSNLLGL
jgi:hypothetical protein